MQQRVISVLKYLSFFAVGVLLLWLAFRGQDFGEVMYKLQQADYRWVALSLIAALLSHFSRAIRWNMLIHPLGYRPRVHVTFYAVMVGYLANLALPRLGEITRCGVLTRYEKVPLNALIGTIIIERGLDLAMLLLVVLLTLLFQMQVMSSFFMDKLLVPAYHQYADQAWSAYYLLAGGVVVLMLLFTGWYLWNYRVRKSPAFFKVRRLIVGFLSGLKSVRRMKNNVRFMGHTCFIFVMYFLMSYFCLFALTATQHLDAGAGLSVFAIGSLGIVAPVQGGLGAYHWLVTEALNVLYAISWDDALIFATVVHSAQTLFVILLGGISLLLLPLSRSKKGEII